jgi:hypothetical protein
LQVNITNKEKEIFNFPKYKQGITYQFTNGNNDCACKVIIHVITNPLFLGLYIPCKRKGDTLQPLEIRVKVEQTRLLIISFQECKGIKFSKE